MKSIRKKWKQGRFEKITSQVQQHQQSRASHHGQCEDTTATLTLIERLRSGDSRLKELAIITLASISHSSPQNVINACVQNDTLQELLTILDSNDAMLVIHDLNAITNLLGLEFYVKERSLGELNVSVFLIEKSLLVRLEKIILSSKAAMRLETTSHQDQLACIRMLQSTFELITCLCENVSDRLLKLVTESPLSAIFLNTAIELVSSVADEELIAVVLGYLQVLTECSGPACLRVIDESTLMEVFSRILKSKEIQDLKFKSLVVSILYNVLSTCEDRLNSDFQVVLDSIVDYILSIMSIKIFHEVSNLKSIMSNNLKEVIDQMNEDDLQHHNAEEAIVDVEENKGKEASRIWFSTAEAMETIMGVLVNLFEKDSDSDLFEEESMDSGCEDNEEESMSSSKSTATTAVVSLSEQTTTSNRVKSYLIQQLSSRALLEMVAEKTTMIEPELIAFFDSYNQVGGQILAQINSTTHFGLSILTNWVYSYRSLLSNADWESHLMPQIWGDLKRRLTAEQSVSHLNEILIMSAKLLLQIAKELQTSSTPLSITEVVSGLKEVITVGSQELTLVFLDLIATICHPKRNITRADNFATGSALINLLAHEDPMVASQTLNTLFDVYSEEDKDDVFVELQLPQLLSNGKELFAAKLPEFKLSLDKSNYEFVKETLLNLKRFIKYKQDHIKA